MTNDENKLNRRMDYKKADMLRKPAIATTTLQVTYVGEGGKKKHATIPAGTPVWYLMSVDWPHMKQVQGRSKGIYSVTKCVLISNVLTEGHAVQVYANEVELWQDYIQEYGAFTLDELEKYLNYKAEFKRLGEICEGIPELED